MMKKPAVLSVLGLAAAIVMVVTLFLPGNGGATVQAATIIGKLNEQMEQNPLIEVTLDSLTIDEAYVNGRLQVAQQGIAGDLRAVVQDDGQEVEVDLALGLSKNGGWVLLRELRIPDPEAQAILAMFMPPDGELLLLLPADAVEGDLGLDLGEELSELRSGELAAVFEELIDTHAEYGVRVENQSDGTVMLSLPIEDEEALQALERLVIRSAEVAAQSQADEGQGSVEIDVDDIDLDGERDLLGSTLTVVYDPQQELVRSFGITDLGETAGSITVAIGQGELDPALLDSSRVTTANTRVFDLAALESIVKQFEYTGETGK